MICESGTGEAARSPGAVSDHAPEAASDMASDAMAQIGRLVATIRAERHADRIVQPVTASGGREQLVTLLRRFVAARETERLAWEEALQQVRAELVEVRALAAAAEAHREEASRLRRDLADLELLHEHQRSIWDLDRRRLEITIGGVAEARAAAARRKRGRVAAGIAAVMCMGLIGLALAATGATSETGASRRVIDGIRSLSSKDLSCLIGCERPPQPVLQQGRL